ncbi:MAG: heavy metal-associated domain-containing protein [Paracoccus sp. (in: a-proteobacteria)]|nr:heavy metal-associated domain-containing protein [Paracoccus sp. (in: a-proteobacteria)]
MKLSVPDMSCAHCEASIVKAVTDAGGEARVDLAAKEVEIEGLSAERAAEVIRDAGFSPAPAPR